MSIIDNKQIIASNKHSAVAKAANNAELKECVQKVLDNYLKDLGDYTSTNLHQLFIAEVEAPLLEAVLSYCKGNQSMAAKMLGLNRSTLRKKIIQYNI